MHRHAIRLSSSPSARYKDDGTRDPISPIMRPSVGDLYRRRHPTVPILQGEHRADTIVGGYPTQSRLQNPSRQVFCDPFPIGQILGHIGKQPEDAVQSALRQSSIDSSRNPLGRLRKRDRHLDSEEVLQLAWQAQRSKRRCSISTIAPLAAPSLDATAPGSCKVSRFNASKLAGDRGDAMKARRDAPMVGPGDHLSHVPDGCDNQCIKLLLGRLVATLRPLWQASPHGTRLLATIKGGHEQRCSGGVKLTVKAGLEHFRNQVVLLETDDKVTQAYINHSGGRSPFLSSIARDL